MQKVIKRDDYLRRLIDKKENGLIKVITGIRRCGKSFLLFNLFYDYLINSGVNEEQIIILSLIMVIHMIDYSNSHECDEQYSYLVVLITKAYSLLYSLKFLN